MSCWVLPEGGDKKVLRKVSTEKVICVCSLFYGRAKAVSRAWWQDYSNGGHNVVPRKSQVGLKVLGVQKGGYHQWQMFCCALLTLADCSGSEKSLTTKRIMARGSNKLKEKITPRSQCAGHYRNGLTSTDFATLILTRLFHLSTILAVRH